MELSIAMHWFVQEGALREYNLIGVLMGLAVYNSIILDLHFPSICYRKLLSPPVVPVDTSNVGIVHMPTVDDLAEIMPVSSQPIMHIPVDWVRVDHVPRHISQDLCAPWSVPQSTSNLRELLDELAYVWKLLERSNINNVWSIEYGNSTNSLC